MNVDLIRKALEAASSLMVIEIWAPPMHQSEKKRRFKAREAVQKLCIEATNELNRAYPAAKTARDTKTGAG